MSSHLAISAYGTEYISWFPLEAIDAGPADCSSTTALEAFFKKPLDSSPGNLNEEFEAAKRRPASAQTIGTGEPAVIRLFGSAPIGASVTVSLDSPQGIIATFESTGTQQATLQPIETIQGEYRFSTDIVLTDDGFTHSANVSEIITLTLTQGASPSVSINLTAFRNPIMVIHGFASSSAATESLGGYIKNAVRPYDVINVDYSSDNSRSFDDEHLQQVVGVQISEALKSYQRAGVIVQHFDAVGHSMGALVARKFSDRTGVIGRIVSIGTPHLGSELPQCLIDSIDMTASVAISNP
ncbi:MAG: hypothetical protein KDB22_29365, partial [Planctomycetales bacterium]|nr:hypothetical protein [Planctomycetales bacterium]